jgi:soluble lytic murein transglycosylase-like protein
MRVKLMIGAAGLVLGAALALPQEPTWQAALPQVASATGVSEELLTRVAWRESRHDTKICSKAGACGLMQLMPGTAKDLRVDALDGADSLRGGAQYISRLRTKYRGNLGLALAAYNWGPTNVDRWVKKGGKVPQETLDYVQALTGRSLKAWAHG